MMQYYIKCFSLLILIFIFQKKEAHAQTFEGGLVLGFNMSQLDGDDLVGWNRIGFNAGGRVAITPYEKWKFNLDILFSQKGSSAAPDQISSYDKVRLNYVEIPIQVNYMDWLDENGFYRLHFLAGFSYSQLVGFQVLRVVEGDTTELEDYKKWNANFQIGATYFIKENIGINGQYALGLLSVDNDPDAQFFRDRALTFRLIYMF